MLVSDLSDHPALIAAIRALAVICLYGPLREWLTPPSEHEQDDDSPAEAETGSGAVEGGARYDERSGWRFGGFPYVVTPVHRQVLHLMPIEMAPEADLLRLVRRQVACNQLPACLVTEWNRGLFAYPSGESVACEIVPASHHWVTGRMLPPPGPVPSLELQNRMAAAEWFARRTGASDALDADFSKFGRQPTDDERLVLTGSDPWGKPRGLDSCPACNRLRGMCLDYEVSSSGLLLEVRCRCENDTLCAACGEPFDPEYRVGSNYFDTQDGRVWHVPDMHALKHRCRPAPALSETATDL